MTFNKADALGFDLSCFDELSPNLSMVSGMECLVQALARRLRSYLWYDPAYGIPLDEYLNADMTVAQIDSLASAVQSQLLQDERVASVRVVGSRTGELADVSLSLSITGVAITGQAFSLTGQLSPTGVNLTRTI